MMEARHVPLEVTTHAIRARAEAEAAATSEITWRILTRLHRSTYQHERETCPEWIDLGGEA